MDYGMNPIWTKRRFQAVEATFECTMDEADALRVQGLEYLDGDTIEPRGCSIAFSP